MKRAVEFFGGPLDGGRGMVDESAVSFMLPIVPVTLPQVPDGEPPVMPETFSHVYVRADVASTTLTYAGVEAR